MALPTGIRPELKEARVEDLVIQLQVARGKCAWQENPDQPDDQGCGGAVFLVGAGCSQSAGIPLAGAIARKEMCDLAGYLSNNKQVFSSPDRAPKWLQQEELLTAGKSWSEYYTEIFDRYYVSDIKQRQIVQQAIAGAKGSINWAHICLGELVDKHYVHTVLTTNFDQLALRGIILTGRIPVVADGAEAINRISSRPTTPQVVHLHGSVNTYSPINSRAALKAVGKDPSVQGMIHGILHDTPLLVVVGYAGGDDGIIENLRAEAAAFSNLIIFWIMHGNNVSSLSNDVHEILDGPNRFYIPGQDADLFFSNMMRMLELRPEWMGDPLSPMVARFKAIKHQGDRGMARALEGYERRVGELRNCATPPLDDDARIQNAAMESLAGQDEAVLGDIPPHLGETNRDAARLLALSLRRIGDAQNSRPKLAEAARYWHICTTLAPADAEAFLQLGQVSVRLALLADAEPAESAKHNAIALSALRQAGELARRPRSGWVESRVGFAEATIEAGTDGGDEADVKEAILGLQQILRDRTYAPSSSKGAAVQDLKSTLYLMQARSTSARADFEQAIKAGLKATSGAWQGMLDSNAVGAHQHLAAAHRDFGIWLMTAHPIEARAHLTKAAAGYERVAQAYQGGFDEMTGEEVNVAVSSALDAVADVRGIIATLPRKGTRATN